MTLTNGDPERLDYSRARNCSARPFFQPIKVSGTATRSKQSLILAYCCPCVVSRAMLTTDNFERTLKVAALDADVRSEELGACFQRFD